LRAVLVLLARAVPAPAAAQTAPAPPAPTVLSVKEVMRHIVNPAAERFWKTSGTVSSEDGDQSRAPTSDASWREMEDAAAIVAEAGNLLAMEARGHAADPRWMRYARQLTDGGIASMAAARAKDPDRATEAGGEMYNACFNCHARYIPRPKNSLWKQP
jgi:hypothetical protein